MIPVEKTMTDVDNAYDTSRMASDVPVNRFLSDMD